MQQMFTCPRCGNTIHYGDNFCNNCRMPLEWQSQQQISYPYQQPAGYDYGYTAPKKKVSPWVTLFTVLAIVVLVIGGIGLATNGTFDLKPLLFTGTTSNTGPTTPTSNSPAPVPVLPSQPSAIDAGGDLSTLITSIEPSIAFILCRYGADKYGTGSGVIVDRSGYIITNKHVIDGAIDISVFLCQNSRVIISKSNMFMARLVARDPTLDLAVIKITPGTAALQSLAMGNSDSFKPLQKVIALGYPFATQYMVKEGQTWDLGAPTVTQGEIASSTLRTVEGNPAIQITAALNPGNSGGALINTSGQLIGIPFGRNPEADNTAFAIPINSAMPLINQSIGK